MDEPKIAEIRRNYVRRAWILFGVPAVPSAVYALVISSSGSLYAELFFCAFAVVLAVYVSYLWSCAMWWCSKDLVLRSFERAATRDKSERAEAATDTAAGSVHPERSGTA